MGSLAERLRDVQQEGCGAIRLNAAITGEPWMKCHQKGCTACFAEVCGRLVDAIEGERSKTEYDGVIPEGIEWPRYESGELVKFGDEIGTLGALEGIKFVSVGVVLCCSEANDAYRYGIPIKRPEPEVLDADRVPIKVGDTVWNVESGKRYEVLKLPAKNAYQSIAVRGEDGTDGFDPTRLTHRNPDTQEAIETDCRMEAYNYLKKRGICPPKSDYESQKAWKRDCRRLQKSDLLERQRKLLGGE